MQKFTVPKLWAALIAVLKRFVPLSMRWAVSLLDASFKEKLSTMKAAASEDELTAGAPDELKDIIQAIFDTLNSFLASRPFILAVVKALEAFVINNLLDAIFDQLTNNGARMAAGHVPMNYQPKNAEALESELDAACALA